MQYVNPSFSVPPAKLKDQKNRHGQTWEDIFNAPPKFAEGGLIANPAPFTVGEQCRDASELFYRPFSKGEIANIFRVPPESVPDATGDSLSHAEPDKTGHTCNGTYKTFSAEHCPYCWAEHAR